MIGRASVRRRSASRWLPIALPAVAVLLGHCSSGRSPRPDGPPRLDTITVRRFGMFSFGASGVVQLPDRRIIIAEDERLHPLVIVDLFGSGKAREFLPPEVAAEFGPAGALVLNDLEAITIDPRGHLYATTSHAVPRSGIRTPDRELVIRFDVNGDTITGTRSTRSLVAALTRLDPGLDRAVGQATKTRGPSPGLNIEGLAWDPRSNHLLFGFRGPLRERDALVVSLDNPDEVFERGAAATLSGPFPIALEGQGIRDLAYVPEFGGFLVVAGSSGMSAWGHAALWFWSGPFGPPPMHLRAAMLDQLKPEGVTIATVDGHRLVVFVCDDGTLDRRYYKGRARVNAGIPSRYVVLPLPMLLADNPALARAPGAHETHPAR